MTPASTHDAPATGEPADGGVTDEELAAWEAQGSPDGSSRTRVVIAAMAVVAIMVAAAIGFSVGRLSTLADPTPTTTSAEAGFSRDMQVHHNQGVELAMLIRDRTDAVDVRTLAYDIARTQSQQSGQMYGWLTEWNLPQAEAEPSMTWMTRPPLTGTSAHDHDPTSSAHTPGEPMPGLATAEQIAELKTLTGVAAEKDFLTLMIAHHKGGVEMAEALLERSTDRVETDFARGIVKAQTSEIDLMENMLAERN